MKLVDKAISFTCLVDEIISFAKQVLLETEVSREFFHSWEQILLLSFFFLTALGGSTKKNKFFLQHLYMS
jgi:hypothetical protein